MESMLTGHKANHPRGLEADHPLFLQRAGLYYREPSSSPDDQDYG